MDSLSTNSDVEPVFSRCSVAGSLQVSPPSVDLLARIALSAFVSLNDSAIWCTTPFGENVAHGSEARWKSPPLAAVPPAQMLKWANERVQLAPPLNEVDATSPCAPPFDQRSCWNAPTMWSGLVGSTATRGSTSAFW